MNYKNSCVYPLIDNKRLANEHTRISAVIVKYILLILFIIGLRCHTIFGVVVVEIILEWVCTVFNMKALKVKKDYSLAGYSLVLYGLCL